MSAVDKVATPVPWEGWNVRARQWRITGSEKMLDKQYEGEEIAFVF